MYHSAHSFSCSKVCCLENTKPRERNQKPSKRFIRDHFIYLFFPFLSYYHEKRRNAIRARVGVAGHLSTTLGWENPVKFLFRRRNKRTCRLAPHCLFRAERQVGKHDNVWWPILCWQCQPDHWNRMIGIFSEYMEAGSAVPKQFL